MKMTLGRSWTQKLAGNIQKFHFEVGVLQDGPHLNPLEAPNHFEPPPLSSYAGGPIRKKSKVTGPLSLGQILLENMKRLNINLLWHPFQIRNSEINKFTDSFLKLALNHPGVTIKRVENLLQAIVRNPILRGDYGSNTEVTSEVKGFNRPMIDTGQMFKAIVARVKRGV